MEIKFDDKILSQLPNIIKDKTNEKLHYQSYDKVEFSAFLDDGRKLFGASQVERFGTKWYIYVSSGTPLCESFVHEILVDDLTNFPIELFKEITINEVIKNWE